MINKMDLNHIEEVVLMALDLWRDQSFNDLYGDFTEFINDQNKQIFTANIDNQLVGFAFLSIRNDYVEGSHSSPVGYLEGIYVKPNFRKMGIAKELLQAGEGWAKLNKCKELGSDIEHDNDVSYHFHKKIGFKEANRLICFIKDIN